MVQREERVIQVTYTSYPTADELPKAFQLLLNKARAVCNDAYAPYSKFKVGAAALLENGEVVVGTNQENASFPAGNCAERSALNTAASLFPGKAITHMAISYDQEGEKSDHPISPCGVCRQMLREFETRHHQNIQLILAGQSGEVFVITSVAQLLPLSFESSVLIK